MILRIGNNKEVHNVGRRQVIFDFDIVIAMACSRRVWSVGSFALCKSSLYVDLLSQYTERSARS